jgi:hypothetical protein
MRTRVWYELAEIKFNVEYLAAYSHFQEVLSRWINIAILIFSSSGILGWQFFQNPGFAGIACAITAFISLVKMISPYFILSDKDVKKLDKYFIQLADHYLKFERLWYDLEDEELNTKETKDKFYELAKYANQIEDKYSDINIIHIKFLMKKAQRNSDDFFYKQFNTKNNE